MRHPTGFQPISPVLPADHIQNKDRQRRRSAKSTAVKQVASDNELGRPIVEEDAQRIGLQAKITRETRRARKQVLKLEPARTT